MSGFIPGFNDEGVVTVNRVLLRPEYSVDDLEERVALLCENVKTYHSDSGFVGGFVALNSGMISNEGSSLGQAVASPLKEREALIVTFWRTFAEHEASKPSSRCSGRCWNCARTATRRSPTACCGRARLTTRRKQRPRGKPRRPTRRSPESL